MSEFTKSGLVDFVKKIEIPLAIVSVCFFSFFIIKYVVLDKPSGPNIIEESKDIKLDYYKDKLSSLYDAVEIFKSDLNKYGETSEVKKQYILLTKMHSDFSSEVNKFNVINKPKKLTLPSLDDIRNLSLNELLVIMFKS